jgi:hypothetical protein
MNRKLYKAEALPLPLLEKIGLASDGRILLIKEDFLALLSGVRTQVLKLHGIIEGDQVLDEVHAKVSLQKNNIGELEVMFHPIYKQSEEVKPEYLSKEEAAQLQENSVNVIWKQLDDPEQGKKEVVIEFDQETREFVTTDTKRVLVPDFVNSEELTPAQKEAYRKGMEVRLSDGTAFRYTGTQREGMVSNRVAIIASIVFDGGISYLLFEGLKSLSGKQHRLNSDNRKFSEGYETAMAELKEQYSKQTLDTSLDDSIEQLQKKNKTGLSR